MIPQIVSKHKKHPFLRTHPLLDEYRSDIYDPSQVIEGFSADMALYYSWFASFGYCTDSVISDGKCCPQMLKDWEIIDHGVDILQREFNYVIFKSDAYKKFVVTVPGTRTFDELVKEATQSYLDFFDQETNVFIFRYYNIRTKGVENLIFSAKNLITFAEHEGYQIIFTGHSLGAAVAVPLALKAVRSGYIDPKVNEPVLIGFGQPRIGNDAFSNEVYKYVPKAYRIERQYDIIAGLPDCLRNPMAFYTCYTDLKNQVFDRSITKYRLNAYYWHTGGLII